VGATGTPHFKWEGIDESHDCKEVMKCETAENEILRVSVEEEGYMVAIMDRFSRFRETEMERIERGVVGPGFRSCDY
jgi:dihydroorotase